MAAGAGLILVSGLAAASISQSLSDRVVVLVAANSIAEGQVITELDLTTASISAPTGVRAIGPSDRADLIGKTATGPVGEGSILHPVQFIDANAEDQASVIVGAALSPGQYPRTGLRAGDRVTIIEVSGPNVGFGDSGAGPRELTEGEIVEVYQLGQSDTLLISLRVNEAVAASVSDRVEQNRITLALLDGDLPSDEGLQIDEGLQSEEAEQLDEGLQIEEAEQLDLTKESEERS